jgi:hypothetical protein
MSACGMEARRILRLAIFSMLPPQLGTDKRQTAQSGAEELALAHLCRVESRRRSACQLMFIKLSLEQVL